MGVDTKLYNYPGSGHALAPPEHGFDACMNIGLWMDKYLVEPFVDEEADLSGAERVLKRVKDRLGAQSLLVMYWDLPARMEKLREESINSEEQLRALSDEKLKELKFPDGLIEELRKEFASQEEEAKTEEKPEET